MFDDRYEFQRSLGEGGMAGVFLARDTNLDRLVAIKRIHADLSEHDAVVARFQREARIIARLRHSHIVDIFDVVADESNNVAMVMEFVDGIDLSTITRRKPALPMPPELAIAIVRPIASALAHAHESGVVHRDIKPANILLGSKGAVKLTDFGIARGDEDAALTRPGDFLGTPAYVPPEQARGQPVGPAADQYALGVMLYQLITGIKPFAAASTGDVLVRIIRGDFTDPRSVSNAIDEPLAALLARMMALNPDDRFADMETTLEAFDTLAKPVSNKELKRRVASLCENASEAVAHWGRELATEWVERAQAAQAAGDDATAVQHALAALARDPERADAKAILSACGEVDEATRAALAEDEEEDENGATIVSPMTFEELMATEGWADGEKPADAVPTPPPDPGGAPPKAPPAQPSAPLPRASTSPVQTPKHIEPQPPQSRPSGVSPVAVSPPRATPAPMPTPAPTPSAEPTNGGNQSGAVTLDRRRSSSKPWTTPLIFVLVAVVFGGGTWLVLELTREKAAPKPKATAPLKMVIGSSKKSALKIQVRVVDAQQKGIAAVPFALAGTPVGKTNTKGVFQISHPANAGDRVNLGLTVPEGYAPLSAKAAAKLSFTAPSSGSGEAVHGITVTLSRAAGTP